VRKRGDPVLTMLCHPGNVAAAVRLVLTIRRAGVGLESLPLDTDERCPPWVVIVGEFHGHLLGRWWWRSL